MLLLRKHRLCMLPSPLGGIVKNIQQLVVIARHIYPFLLKRASIAWRLSNQRFKLINHLLALKYLHLI